MKPAPQLNRQCILAARPIGRIKETDFAWRTEPVPVPAAGQVLVHNRYLSLDPTMRGWMSEFPSYLPPVALGAVMRGTTIGVVAQSRNPHIPEGATVMGMLGCQDYALSDGGDLQVLPPEPALPPTTYLGLLLPGLTAYFGLLDIGKPQLGETLVVTAAAGSVGSLVGQIGKLKGCRVIGIAGSAAKCAWLREELGFDAAINYKTEPVFERLQEACPKGIDVHFECVGGPLLDVALTLITCRARIVLCGMIALYNATEPPPGPSALGNLIVRRARMEGFLVLDYLPRAEEAFADLLRWYGEGRLHYRVDVVDGLEQVPCAINKLFDGTNTGKLIVKL